MLLRELAAYSPTLVGTYPLGLQVAGSDIDIACEADDLAQFERDLIAAVGPTPRIERLPGQPPALAAAFSSDGLPIEVFCQSLAVTAQHGFRHMIVEGRLLAAGGPELREAIRARKRAGQKTEPAFAAELGLTGDPYVAVLDLEAWSTEALERLVSRRRS
jgi:hypothetical protein